MTTSTEAGKQVARRAGYVIAAAVNAVLLYLINGRPGWAVLPFLTGDVVRVLPLINLSLVAGIAVNLIYVIRDSRWLVAAGGLITTGVGLAALAKLWQVFPFDFAAGSPWPTVTRVLLLLGIAGSMVGLVVQLVALARATAGRSFSG
ncbi:hypothetical protein [Actinoplanes subtropicus]|uniref:hypothetical protein n=1 Tax=Actinoplanes subtropicus TaxID=543632 RepID=UPI0004C38F75|nr:hypothetical protein [Actinoplanes subtropicus]